MLSNRDFAPGDPFPGNTIADLRLPDAPLPDAPLPGGRCHVGVRLDRELEASLQAVARQAGCSLSACVRQALRLYLHQFRDGEQTRRQSRLVARLEATDQLEAQLPHWSDWT